MAVAGSSGYADCAGDLGDGESLVGEGVDGLLAFWGDEGVAAAEAALGACGG
ncbi:MAG: hypothetical protein V9F00_11935 [Nocardioides sp.]